MIGVCVHECCEGGDKDDRAISMRTLVSTKVMGDRAHLYKNIREREGDDEGDRAISMRTSKSAKVMGMRDVRAIRWHESASVVSNELYSTHYSFHDIPAICQYFLADVARLLSALLS